MFSTNFMTQDKALGRVTLKVDGKTLDRIRIPQRCEAPEVLPESGRRAIIARLSAINVRWRF